MPLSKSRLRRASFWAFLVLLIVAVLGLVASRITRRAKQADESVYLVRPMPRGKATTQAQKPPAPAPRSDDIAGLVASGLSAFRAEEYTTAEEAWQKALIAAQRRRADNKEVGDIVFRMAAVAGKLGHSEEAKLLLIQAQDFWTQARMSQQDQVQRRTKLLKDLQATKDPPRK